MVIYRIPLLSKRRTTCIFSVRRCSLKLLLSVTHVKCWPLQARAILHFIYLHLASLQEHGRVPPGSDESCSGLRQVRVSSVSAGMRPVQRSRSERASRLFARPGGACPPNQPGRQGDPPCTRAPDSRRRRESCCCPLRALARVSTQRVAKN